MNLPSRDLIARSIRYQRSIYTQNPHPHVKTFNERHFVIIMRAFKSCGIRGKDALYEAMHNELYNGPKQPTLL